VIELDRSARSVVECCAEPSALDELDVPEARVLRVAPDQAMLVGEAGRGHDLVGGARQSLGARALVEDATDGWSAWVLRGDDLPRAFSFLSRLEPPGEGFIQGDVARVPVKVISSPGRLELLVPSMWSEHLRDRIVRRCASCGVDEVWA
jgi:uncharacterized protein YbjT (DUF2867 family)